MSDIAPFVAATIRDKVVDDLMKENADLKLKLSRMQEIELTGPNGTPVYATGMLDQGKYTYAGMEWFVELVEQAKVPPSAFVHSWGVGGGIEVRVGGSVWKILNVGMDPKDILDMFSKRNKELKIDLRDCSDLLSVLERQNPEMCLSLRGIKFDVTKIKGTLKNLGIVDMNPVMDMNPDDKVTDNFEIEIVFCVRDP
eukprot:scaffold5585_cov57-Attheya_sp.AAC.1